MYKGEEKMLSKWEKGYGGRKEKRERERSQPTERQRERVKW